MVGFVGLVLADNHFNRMWPWWLIALVGIGLVLAALGNPTGTKHRVESSPRGSRFPSSPS
jgi:hypothetical protein